jgi:hypothetical protein
LVFRQQQVLLNRVLAAARVVPNNQYKNAQFNVLKCVCLCV